ncbi:MAG TPA: L,D-transpeptidase family protein [Stellaceae bacterium]|nr:L,D-transpeptidase family protein [Stellaceae bacterium]
MRPPFVFAAFLAFLCSWAPLGAAGAPGAATRPAAAAGESQAAGVLQQLLGGTSPLFVAGRQLDLESLQRLYKAEDFSLIWVGHEARIAALATALADAAEDGLDMAMPAEAQTGGKGIGAAERDLLLSDAALRLARALAAGRVQPQEIEDDWAIPTPAFDAAEALAHALGGDRLGPWFAALAPQHLRYTQLKAALAHYRDLARAGSWPKIPRGATIKLGMADDRVGLVRARLVAEGYLPADAPGDNTFDAALEAAVRAYQLRNGIVVDGAVGPKTVAAMNVPVRARVDQIALNLERWRELPRDFGKSYILVNVPGEQLEVVQDGATVMTMKVIVGDPGHPTPVVQSRIAAVTINPPWRVPLSIARSEIVPKVKADPRYLEKNEMVMKGAYLFEQLPGPKNPLGRVKLEMPNKFDVYLHDTSTHGTFERAARALSHGCVRMEEARELAAYVLDPVKWTSGDIARAIDSGETRRLEVMRHLRVELLYFTAFVDADGAVEFRDDIYGRDKRLRAALLGEIATAAIKSAQASR